jgi:hypothetical protein
LRKKANFVFLFFRQFLAVNGSVFFFLIDLFVSFFYFYGRLRFVYKKLYPSPALPAGEGAAVISCNAQLADQEIPQGSPSLEGVGGEENNNNYYLL